MNNSTWISLLHVLLAGLVSAVIVLRCIPTVNQIARSKGLLNITNSRTSHRYSTPNLGGISIFLGCFFASLLFIDSDLMTFKFVFLGALITFFTGVQDDIVAISPWKKLFVQFGVSILLVLGDLRFAETYNFLGIAPLSELASSILTICAVIGLMNAFNLTDGIDGLLATIANIIFGFFGLFFFLWGMTSWAVFCASFMGALLVFFQYNVFGLRNKTFMGDCGSLVIGLAISAVTIKFWETNAHIPLEHPFVFKSTPAIVFAVLIIPVFDTVRVFIYRIAHRISPFVADRNHLHHRLVDIGFAHLQASLILGALNILMILIAFGLSFFVGMIWITLALIALMLLFVSIVNRIHRKKQEKKKGRRNKSTFSEEPDKNPQD